MGKDAAPAPVVDPSILPIYAIESVDRALQLMVLLSLKPELRVTDVSTELNVAPSTAHRLLATLAHRDFVTLDPRTHLYHAGPALWNLARTASSGLGLLAKARPHLTHLAGAVGECVNLVVLDGPLCRFVDGVRGKRPILTSVRTGALLPSHATSGGKALLAELTRVQLQGLFPSRRLPALTERTIDGVEQLQTELSIVRSRGYSINHGESEEGITAVALPVRGADGTAVAALAVSAPNSRLRPLRVLEIVDELAQAAGAIGRDLDR